MKKLSDITLLTLLGIFSFWLTFTAGERGFFAFDQSIVFDGGYRILSGQVPYKDFLIPIGPMAFVLQALFFKLLGVSYRTYILGAAAVNVLAVILSVFIVRFLFPSKRALSYTAGLLTAAWFYPPFGTPYIDQTGFFFIIVALFLTLFAIRIGDKYSITSGLIIAVAGRMVFLSLITKQNIGLLILPLCPLMLIAAYVSDWKKLAYRLCDFTIGIGLSALLFFLWLYYRSNLDNFILYTIRIPSRFGIKRISHLNSVASLPVVPFVEGWEIWWFKLRRSLDLVLLGLGINMVTLPALYLSLRKSIKPWLMPSLVCLYLIHFQYLFLHTTSQQSVNGLPFIGIIASIAIGLLFELADFTLPPVSLKRERCKKGMVTVVTMCTFFLLVFGVKVSLGREGHIIFDGTDFPRYFPVDKLEGLRWGNPTIKSHPNQTFQKSEPEIIREEDIVNLLKFLKSSKANFFVFPDFTIFYGLANVPSPQPVLWFHHGLTYPVEYNPKLDEWIIRSLKRNEVRIIVLEDKFWDTGRIWDFPLLSAYIRHNFKKTNQIGIFSIYRDTGVHNAA